MQTTDILRLMLMYFVLPLWLAAGFADYLCDCAAHIESNSGWKESLLHLLQPDRSGASERGSWCPYRGEWLGAAPVVCWLDSERMIC
jgi:hypothetical protein